MKRSECWLWSAPVVVLLVLFVVARVKDQRAQENARKERIQIQVRQQQWKDSMKATQGFIGTRIREMQKRESQLKNKQRKAKANTAQSRQIQSELRNIASQLWQLKTAKARFENAKMPTYFVDNLLGSGLEVN